ncbi:hypothetical protein M422DRAFT_23685 [Sphaerobolus stellatus SS14]|nr:hypothetical protein M422DRAFT_23685 [Sphaerobolus stellatus SS14]
MWAATNGNVEAKASERSGGSSAVGGQKAVDNNERRNVLDGYKGKQRESVPYQSRNALPGSSAMVASSSAGGTTPERKVGGARVKGACEACKSSKVRCELTSHAASGVERPESCRRCFLAGIPCRVPGRKPKKPPPSQNELERKLQEKNDKIIQLMTVNTSPSSISPQHYPIPHTNAFPPHSISGLSDHNLVDEILNLPVWEKNLPKAELEQKLEDSINIIRRRLENVQIGLDPFVGEDSSPVSGSVAGNHYDDGKSGSVGGNTKPRWEIEYERAQEDDLDIEEGDKGAAGRMTTKEDCPVIMRQASYTRDDLDNFSPKRRLPAILEEGIVDMETCRELFDLFHEKINMFFSTCDPVIHTVDNVLRTSSFLFTTMCAVASRHYSKNKELYPRLIKAAKEAAGRIVPKAVETCQAYMLLGVYSPPSRTFEEDRTYWFFGMATRIATDLQLYRTQYSYPPPPDMPELEARAVLNRARVWLNCYCTDLSISTQLGRPASIVFTSTTAGGANPIPLDRMTWWRCSKFNMGQDFHLCAYASLLEVMSDFHTFVFTSLSEGPKKVLDLGVIQRLANKVTAVEQEWLDLLRQYFPERFDRAMEWRDNLWPFLCAYAKLVVLSIGLRDAMRSGFTGNNPFFDQCVTAATTVLKQVRDKMAPLGCMRYCPEAYFVFTGFAAAFLLKILRPKFSFMMRHRAGLEKEIIALIQSLITLLGSDEVAIDNRHTPKLYARFLAGLVEDHLQGRTGIKKEPEHLVTSTTPEPIQIQVTDAAAPGPIDYSDSTSYGQQPTGASTDPLAGHVWPTAHQASSGYISQPTAQLYPPHSQFPSPAYEGAQLPAHMDVDYTTYMPNNPLDFTVNNQRYPQYPQPIPPTPADSMTLLSMHAINNEHFWNEPVMPGSWGLMHPGASTWSLQTQSNFSQDSQGSLLGASGSSGSLMGHNRDRENGVYLAP